MSIKHKLCRKLIGIFVSTIFLQIKGSWGQNINDTLPFLLINNTLLVSHSIYMCQNKNMEAFTKHFPI